MSHEEAIKQLAALVAELSKACRTEAASALRAKVYEHIEQANHILENTQPPKQ